MVRKSTTPKPIRPFLGLEFIGIVNSKKTVYYVFGGGDDYLVCSFRDATYQRGNFNIVPRTSAERILSEFKGEKRVTSKAVQDHPKMKAFFAGFEVLQALYVLAATGNVKIDRRSPRKTKLFFNFGHADQIRVKRKQAKLP